MEELLLAINPDSDDIYTQILKNHYNDRRIIINQAIAEDLLENVCLMILKWNTEDKLIPVKNRKKIYIYLNTPGGDAVMGSTILAVIKNSKTPVVTVGFATCESMGSYILAAGHTRYCFPSTVVLYHDGQTGYVSSGNKGRDIQKFYDELDRRLTAFMIENTKMTAEFLEKIKDREYYMFPEQLKELAIVDKIIGVDCELDEIL